MIASFGSWSLDLERRLVTDDGGVEVHLTPKAFDLLAILLGEAPRVVRKNELHARLWPDTFVSEATLSGLVKELRYAFRQGPTRADVIRTSHGIGYAFEAAVTRADDLETISLPWVVTPDRRIRLARGENLIGREPGAQVWLNVAGVSRRHALIVVSGSQARLEDLGSKNGTLLGAAPCREPTLLKDGDTIDVGPVSLVFRASEVLLSTETSFSSPASS